MGFRSTFTVEDFNIEWPDWFFEKYKHLVWFNDNRIGTIASKHEAKTYLQFSDLPTDIQKAINWEGGLKRLVLVYLHECGGITRVQISEDSIKWSEPKDWKGVEDVEHDYCYGCSDR